MPRSREPTCACVGCPGGPRRTVSGHDGPCPRVRPWNAAYGGFCKVCARHYLCARCGTRSYDAEISPIEHLCEPCLSKRRWFCQCPGCAVDDDSHVHLSSGGKRCPRFQDKRKSTHGFCAKCARTWTCAGCHKRVTECARRPVARVCEFSSASSAHLCVRRE